MTSLASLLERSPYQSYSYSYPHKTAYQHFDKPYALKTLWQDEVREQLFLYTHIPFCAMRCGFCNLFTIAQPQDDLTQRYVNQLLVQMNVIKESLQEHRFVRFAMGGGTPTYLNARQLETIFTGLKTHLNVDLKNCPSGIEVSPDTLNIDHMKILVDQGISRISIGVQTFDEEQGKLLARPQMRELSLNALTLIRQHTIQTLNIDLIYGIANQTVESFCQDIEIALRFAPEEIFLYPLYVRPKTGLAKIAFSPNKHHLNLGKTYAHILATGNIALHQETSWDHEHRLMLYRAGRDYLLNKGYRQTSMRMFVAPHVKINHDIPNYTCQNDGMVGLGVGARSYTSSVHYASAYAVSRTESQSIIENYCNLQARDFSQANYGIALDIDEQKRRFVIQSILSLPGLDETLYAQRFGCDVWQDFPALNELLSLNLMEKSMQNLWILTEKGLERSDTIGPWLISENVKQRMQAYQLR